MKRTTGTGVTLKTIVENRTENEKTPFLRGILIRSLLDAGLSFEDAFDIAAKIRNRLSDTKIITTEELQEQVASLLAELDASEALEQYCYPSTVTPRIIVSTMDGVQRAFSRGRKSRYLQSTGMGADKAEQITELIHAQLIAAGISRITSFELGYLTYLCLQQEVSQKAADRYLVWSEYQNSNKPLILLISGTVASGKSTIATDVAHLLEIVRIQSTDMLREVMRMMIPEKLLPVLHTSSFDAWKKLPIRDKKDRDFDDLVAEGYRSQSELLAVPCEAILQRAVEEGVPIIMEGVHAHPDLLKLSPDDTDVIKVYVMLAVLKSKKIKSRLKDRGSDIPQRKAKRYLNSLKSIWSLQSFLLSEADRCDVPIITSGDRDTVARQIIQQVNRELSNHFNGTVQDVFGDVVERLQPESSNAKWYEYIPLLRD